MRLKFRVRGVRKHSPFMFLGTITNKKGYHGLRNYPDNFLQGCLPLRNTQNETRQSKLQTEKRFKKMCTTTKSKQTQQKVQIGTTSVIITKKTEFEL